MVAGQPAITDGWFPLSNGTQSPQLVAGPVLRRGVIGRSRVSPPWLSQLRTRRPLSCRLIWHGCGCAAHSESGDAFPLLRVRVATGVWCGPGGGQARRMPRSARRRPPAATDAGSPRAGRGTVTVTCPVPIRRSPRDRSAAPRCARCGRARDPAASERADPPAGSTPSGPIGARRRPLGHRTYGLGSTTSHGSRCADSTFPACKSVTSSTSRPVVVGSVRSRSTAARARPGSHAPGIAASRSENSEAHASHISCNGRNGWPAVGDPQFPQQAGHHDVLLRLRNGLRQGGAGTAALQQQGAGSVADMHVMEPDRAATPPGA
jgi:hypothetical protein